MMCSCVSIMFEDFRDGFYRVGDWTVISDRLYHSAIKTWLNTRVIQDG